MSFSYNFSLCTATLLMSRCKSSAIEHQCANFILISRSACTVYRCGPLLQVPHVAWSVCLCVLGTRVSCATYTD